MRHLGSLIAGILITPLAWGFIAFGQQKSAATVASWTDSGTFDTGDLLKPAGFLLAAGILIGLVAALRVSPLGALLAGLVYVVTYVVFFLNPLDVRDAIPEPTVLGTKIPLRTPLDNGTLLLIGAALLVAVVSVGRWRRWPVVAAAEPGAAGAPAPAEGPGEPGAETPGTPGETPADVGTSAPAGLATGDSAAGSTAPWSAADRTWAGAPAARHSADDTEAGRTRQTLADYPSAEYPAAYPPGQQPSPGYPQAGGYPSAGSTPTAYPQTKYPPGTYPSASAAGTGQRGEAARPAGTGDDQTPESTSPPTSPPTSPWSAPPRTGQG
jgi:hypothetical protein